MSKEIERTTKGKIILHPHSLITASPKFTIAVHPVSREIYKIGEKNEDGLIKMTSLSGSNKIKYEDSTTPYNFPYIMTTDKDFDVFPIDYEWQKIFTVYEQGKTYDVNIKKVLGVDYVAFKAESARMYTLTIPEGQIIKLNKTELAQLNNLLKGIKKTITRFKR